MGQGAAENVTTGSYNVCIGNDAGDAITTGGSNVLIGRETAADGVDSEHQIVIGTGLTGKSDNTCFIGASNGGNEIYNTNNTTAWNQVSDRRIKKNIVDNKKGLEYINKIKIRNFDYKTVDEIVDFDKPETAVINKTGTQLGTVAQELEEFLPEVVTTLSTGVKSVSPENFTWYLINAVQELSAEVEELKSKLNEE